MKALALVSILACTTAFATQFSDISPPTTPLKATTDEYQGEKVTDSYRWLEKTDDPEVVSWTKAQATYARTFLDRLPNLKDMKEKLQKWNDFRPPAYGALQYFGTTYFAMKLQPPKNQPMLMRLGSIDDLNTEHVILDPNTLDSSGTTAMDFFVPSHDGKYVAVSLSKGGSEEGTLHIYSTSDGKELAEQIPLVQKPTGGGSFAWGKDNKILYYTRYPHPGEKPKADLDFYQQVYQHKIGTPVSDDTYLIGKDFPRIAEIQLATTEDGGTLLVTVANGDGGEFAHYLMNDAGKWTQITKYTDQIKHGVFGLHDDLYLLSIKDAPRGKILRLMLKEPELGKAHEIVHQSASVIEEILPTQEQLFVSRMSGGPTDIKVYSSTGKVIGDLKVQALSSNGGLARGKDGAALFQSQSYLEPTTYFEAKGTSLLVTAVATKSPVDFSDISVKRETAISKDGTKIPLTLIYKRGFKRNGKNPTILYGYGGYGVSISPRFRPDTHLWLEKGGVYAFANLRGGGEFGDSWHLAGNLTKKQNVFDDFIACAKFLIDSKVTSTPKLAIEGGSNGGLLMGAVLTQRPDLFQAVVTHVGIYDMLRVETDPNGAFNVTEFGSTKDPDQFKALYAYSPLHHVKDGVNYPAVLLTTGANDGRVNPYHSKKMAARLQAVASKGTPVLLRVTFDGGHGIGSSVAQRVSEEADVYAFLFDQLGMQYKAVQTTAH